MKITRMWVANDGGHTPTVPSRRVSRAAFSLLAAVAVVAVGCGEPAVRVVRVPLGFALRSPSVQVTDAERVYIAYGTDESAVFVVRSDDGGVTFGEPASISGDGAAYVSGEWGPKIAVGGDESLHLLWMRRVLRPDGSRGRKTEFVYQRSLDGGSTWSEPRRIQDENQPMHEGVANSADERGNVAIVWLDSRVQPDADTADHGAHGSALPLVLARSGDNGATFSANHVVESPYAGDACICCAPDLAWRDGRLLIAFRGASENIRDIHVLEEEALPASFRHIAVADQGWELDGCPADGPRLTVSATRLGVAWMSEGQVYHASADANGRFGEPRPPTAARQVERGFPFALRNRRHGDLLAWTEGGSIHWELLDGAGASTGSSSRPAAGGRPTGYVDGEDRFVLVF